MGAILGSTQAIVPMLSVTLAALACMAAEAFREPGEHMPVGGLGIVGLLGAGISAAFLWNGNTVSFGVISGDNFGLFVTLVLVVVGILTIMFSSQVIHRDGIPPGEYYTLILFSIAGMIMMATANDLLVIFIALEVLSLAVYVLTGIRREDPRATEAAFKYFLLGAFSSAFFLYGIAFTFGLTGSTHLDRIGSYLAAQSLSDNPLILVALGLLLVGFAFKISAVPFHMWTPDAYEGAPAIVTGFMSTGVKAAAFAAFARVFLSAFEPFSADWVPVVWVLAAATMIVGTVVGVAQSNLKRMLAYSSIAHGGYLLVGLVAANQVGKAAILFYLLAYAVTNLAAFGVIALRGTRENEHAELREHARGPAELLKVRRNVPWSAAVFRATYPSREESLVATPMLPATFSRPIMNAVVDLYTPTLGQWQESGRDQEHTQLGVGQMAMACQVAWNQGVDLFGYSSNRLLAGAEGVEGALRGDGERLHADHVLGTPGQMHLAGRDHGGDAAVQVAVDPVHLLLARRPVAEHRVDVAVDEAGRHGRALGAHDRLGAADVEVLQAADRQNAAAVAQDRVGIEDRLAQVARQQEADIPDDELARGCSGGLRRGHGAPFPVPQFGRTLTGSPGQTSDADFTMGDQLSSPVIPAKAGIQGNCNVACPGPPLSRG